MIEQALCIIAFILAAAFCIAFCGLCVYVAVMFAWSSIVSFVRKFKIKEPLCEEEQSK